MRKDEKLVVGDHVVWTSGAGGRVKLKNGTVIAVVEAGRSVGEAVYDLGADDRYSLALGFGEPRDHESYLILGPAREGRTKRQVYWPLVRHLTKVTKKEEPLDVR